MSAGTTSEQNLFGSNWPLGYAAGSANLYRYAGNAPTMTTDPTGLDPAASVGEQVDSGAIFGNQGNAIPLSIVLTPAGAQPFIRENNPKPFQQQQFNQTEPNTNPWLSRGGPNARVGDTIGSAVNLEVVITFDKKPCPGQWGREVWANSFFVRKDFTPHRDGSVSLNAKPTDDTSLYHDYISRNKVYMYDGPGRPIGGWPTFVFRVWAKSLDGKTELEKWFYVDGSTGKSYEIAKPKPYSPPRKDPLPVMPPTIFGPYYGDPPIA